MFLVPFSKFLWLMHVWALFEPMYARDGVWFEGCLEHTQPVAYARVGYLECPCWKFVPSIPGSTSPAG